MVKNLCFDQFYANLTQTCQIQLAFPHLAVRPLCLSLVFLPISLSQRPFSLSTTVLPSFLPSMSVWGFAFTILWTHAWIRPSLTFCHSPPALFLAIALSFQHRHCHSFPTQRRDTITQQGSCCTFSCLKSLLPPFKTDQNTSSGFGRALDYYLISLTGNTSLWLYFNFSTQLHM